MLHWVAHTILAVLICALIGALGYGCCYFHRDAVGQRAVAAQVPVLTAALAATTKAAGDAASADTRRCSADVAAGVRAGAVIARASTPRPRTSPNTQAMQTAETIREAMR